MNHINYQQTGGFPLDLDNLDFLQKSLQIFQAFGFLAGDLAIISGCEKSGSNISDGVVFINGEVLKFEGGTQATNVVIVETSTSGIFEDGTSKPIEISRTARFGTSANSYPWANFKRGFPTTQIKAFKDDFEQRITQLEEAPSPIPVGMIAIWNKPANVPIPTGWQECSDLRGRVPVGWQDNDTDFGTIGSVGGEKKHQLTITEMPSHQHKQGSEALYHDYGGGSYVGARNYPSETSQPSYRNQYTQAVGGNQAHNNLQPYRVIRFIEYVG